ncbi:unnamed protein product [Allacma fusca]|uniref:HTH psq-type domain-containing protein n=1 Tax=Allacma fusca TaxID=39272 RepID=A0A8J2PS76_9HEXA|nr:unnamed protein product [Allacma fusca]
MGGVSISNAAEVYGIPRRTLERKIDIKLQGGDPGELKNDGGFQPVFSSEEENRLEQYLIEASESNHDTQAAVSTGVKNKRGKKPHNAGCNSTDEHVATGTQNVPDLTQMKTACGACASIPSVLQAQTEAIQNLAFGLFCTFG